MKICLLQLNSRDNKEANLAKVAYFVAQACELHQPDLIALPEMWAFRGGSLDQKQQACESILLDDQGPSLRLLKQLALEYCVYIHGGSFCELAGNIKYNTTCVVNPRGQLICRYRKMNLFHYTSRNKEAYVESAFCTPGTDIATYDCHGLNIGCAICFDLRFGSVFQQFICQKVDAIILPSAFTYETGEAHWEILCRARAIETQSYLIAPAQTGSYEDDGVWKRSWGHSMIIDPWGNVISSLQEQEGIIAAKIDVNLIREIRSRLPVVCR